MMRLLLVFLLALGFSLSAAQPNILFILTEDQGAQMSGLGRTDIQTPRTEKIGSRSEEQLRKGYPLRSRNIVRENECAGMGDGNAFECVAGDPTGELSKEPNESGNAFAS
ncbi:MAG: hypothetical protein K1X78_02480 [Verrucomicrobiaceae bacterium]|nr:hypothetical protein [Verrucomicrobiaceae bacterium]